MQATISELKGQRVQVTFLGDDENLTGVLEGVTSETLFLRGVPAGITRTDVADVTPAPLFCANCARSAFRLFDELCADCYRAEAAQAPKSAEPCEVCGAPGVRNMKVRRLQFLCAEHHAETGDGLLVHPSAAATIAACATEDVDSPMHEWGQVRGARFRCIRCKRAEKWDSELLAEMMKDRL